MHQDFLKTNYNKLLTKWKRFLNLTILKLRAPLHQKENLQQVKSQAMKDTYKELLHIVFIFYLMVRV